MAKFSPLRAACGRSVPNSARVVESGPKLAESGRRWPKLGHNWPRFGRIRPAQPNSNRLRPNLGVLGVALCLYHMLVPHTKPQLESTTVNRRCRLRRHRCPTVSKYHFGSNESCAHERRIDMQLRLLAIAVTAGSSRMRADTYRELLLSLMADADARTKG